MKKDRVKAVRTEGLIILPGGNIAGSAMGKPAWTHKVTNQTGHDEC